MLLRVFFLSELTPAERQSYLDTVHDAAVAQAAELETLRTTIESIDAPLASNGLLALEYGVRLARLQAEWAAWAAVRV